jgi:hypothetical protein
MAAETQPHVLMTADTVGGVWSHVLELAAGLGELGMRVAIAAMGTPVTEAQREQIGRLPTVTLHEKTYRLEWMAEPWKDVRLAGQWLLRLEAQLQPRLVHLNQFAFGSLPFAARPCSSRTRACCPGGGRCTARRRRRAGTATAAP